MTTHTNTAASAVADATSKSSCSSSFLRRLVDMLSENEGVISFVPGSTKKGTLGRIVVHDRIKVESDVLPKYFNHSSFASLRRQLNYFSFQRQGKGRQKCATYSNDQVVEMEDILRLRRRPVPPVAAASFETGGESRLPQQQPSSSSVDVDSAAGAGLLAAPSTTTSNSNGRSSGGSKKRSRQRDASPSSGGKKSRFTLTTPTTTTSTVISTLAVVSPNLVSPRSSPSHSATPSPKLDGGVRITLDLTVPPPPELGVGTKPAVNIIRNESAGSSVDGCLGGGVSSSSSIDRHEMEADILAGCQVLLSLKHTRNVVVPSLW